MSQNGFIVFTATTEMSKQTNRALRSGVTYVAQPAKVAKMAEDNPSKVSSKAKAKAKDKATTEKKATKAKTKATTEKVKAVKATKATKATKRPSVRPEAIVKFVHENDGCNMTDIEAATKLPQSRIRQVINEAREAGEITTSGQRRGLRYHAGAGAGVVAETDSN